MMAIVYKNYLISPIKASLLVLTLLIPFVIFAQTTAEEHSPASGAPATEHAQGASHEEPAFKPGDYAVHHIADANTFHIYGELYLPLPVILYSKDQGFLFTMSSAFHPVHHSTGTKAIDGYVLSHGSMQRIVDPSFPKGTVDVDNIEVKEEEFNKKKIEVHYVTLGGKEYKAEHRSIWDGGLMAGGVTSFMDFSITKNVFTMLMVLFLLMFVFFGIKKAYKTRSGMAPKGLQSFLEPVIEFIRDDVAKPNIGHNYERFMPFLLSLFFFILGLNLIGQIPFFPGSANVTGNISVTIVLALLVFLMTNLNGTKYYWGHILWMPGVPAWLKVLILTPIEILGVFIKPFTLFLRLFANIAAGHIVILSFVSLIFVFGKAGESLIGTTVGATVSIPLSLFMSAIELLVAFLQAYLFTMLTASYIGSAIEEHH